MQKQQELQLKMLLWYVNQANFLRGCFYCDSKLMIQSEMFLNGIPMHRYQYHWPQNIPNKAPIKIYSFFLSLKIYCNERRTPHDSFHFALDSKKNMKSRRDSSILGTGMWVCNPILTRNMMTNKE